MWQKKQNKTPYQNQGMQQNNFPIRHFNGSNPVYNLGSGDSYYIPSFLSRKISDSSFISLLNGNEIKWYQTYIFNNGQMFPQKRLSNTQIRIKNQPNTNHIVPLYRYPTNNLQTMPITRNYTKSTQPIIDKVEKQLCQPINHAVIAVYRNGNDYIGFHCDKMLDIHNQSQIASISLGTKRRFVFKQLDGDQEDHIMLHHGSVIVIGPQTNKYFRHSIPKDRYINTPRISISQRYIATFWDKKNNYIFGQGQQFYSLNYPLKPFDKHNIYHKIHIVHYKFHELNKFNISLQCNCNINAYKYDIDADDILMKYKKMEICYSLKDSYFRCILFANIGNKSKGYEILKYLKQEKHPNCVHIPYGMIINDKINECSNDGEPQRAKIGEYLLNVLKQNDMNKNAMIVVIRHWLGTKLGAKNLYNAYRIVSQSLFKQTHYKQHQHDEYELKEQSDENYLQNESKKQMKSQTVDWKQKYFALKREYDYLKKENMRLESQINK